MKILITNGGTRVPIDDVRHIGNSASGRYGANLAAQLSEQGHDVTLFTSKYDAPNQEFEDHQSWLADHGRFINIIEYEDYYSYLNVKELITVQGFGIIISAAAVSDYVVDRTPGKISSDLDAVTLTLRKSEKVLPSFRLLAPEAFIVGFKLLVNASTEEINAAVKKQLNQGVDAVVFNDLHVLRKGNPSRHIYTNTGHVQTALTTKSLAQGIVDLAAFSR